MKARICPAFAPALALALLAGCTGYAGPVPGPQGPSPAGFVLPGTTGAPPAQPYANVCHAGFYICTMPESLPVGTRCSCPGLGAPSFGSVQ